MLPTVDATRYTTPLREGGSLPGIVEATDLGTYVAKFRGAGQGPAALVAEVVVAGLARRLGLRVPDLVALELDPGIGRLEPDPEIQHLLVSSAGTNLGVDWLPGSVGFEPAGFDVDPLEAARVMWLDALTVNVDRTWRNPNLLVWHGDLWLIDHGAALVWQHQWPPASGAATRRLELSDHVLAPFTADLADADLAAVDQALATRVDPGVLHDVLADVPTAWLDDLEGPDEVERARARHVEVLAARLAEREPWRPSRAPTGEVGR
ncbi:HipA family kinase [Salsipaludibacter albus]|uniref:HipA family kinase n=1 Tax=Salsipaludibacter albus TaxID=2849650 RepID=UPI001EE4876D|nr:HipA family kinase [Salsipaludibacter albus]MBY5160879.1 aminotransferase class I and II [Salsipaludibacter albus]